MGCNTFPDILRKTRNIHKRLLHWSNIFSPSCRTLEYWTHNSCPNSEKKQTRIWPTFHSGGMYATSRVGGTVGFACTFNALSWEAIDLQSFTEAPPTTLPFTMTGKFV